MVKVKDNGEYWSLGQSMNHGYVDLLYSMLYLRQIGNGNDRMEYVSNLCIIKDLNCNCTVLYKHFEPLFVVNKLFSANVSNKDNIYMRRFDLKF